jgi:ABC-type bacteriocin/lantibiotic exporter with double-glycine peptidase domain
MKPELLILDESTNSLDVTSIQNIQQLLKKLRGKLTIIIISHQAEMCEFTDQIISLKPTKPILNHGDIAWTSSIPA